MTKCDKMAMADESDDDENTGHSDQLIKYERIDMYWSKVGHMPRPSGERKYPTLMKLARIALTLNHGNADIERGFSKNKLMVTSHRTRLSMPTISGLRTVSSYVAKYNSEPHKLPYSKDLIGKQEEKDADDEKSEMHDLQRKKESSELLLQEGIGRLNEAIKMKDKSKAMTKIEAANAITQNSRKALSDVEQAISQGRFSKKRHRKRCARHF